MVKKKKSELQKKLESQGWEFITNVDPKSDLMGGGDDDPLSSRSLHPKSDGELREIYLQRNFKEVKVADAYDIEGNPALDCRAIYVKK